MQRAAGFLFHFQAKTGTKPLSVPDPPACIGLTMLCEKNVWATAFLAEAGLGEPMPPRPYKLRVKATRSLAELGPLKVRLFLPA